MRPGSRDPLTKGGLHHAATNPLLPRYAGPPRSIYTNLQLGKHRDTRYRHPFRRYSVRTHRCLLTVALLALPATRAADRFDTKLTTDQQIVHVLNRLTFGPRPGDIEEVRRIGVDKWIDQQLH